MKKYLIIFLVLPFVASAQTWNNSTLSSYVRTLQTQMTTATSKNTSQDASIAALTTKVNGMATTISTINATVATLNKTIASLQSTVDSLRRVMPPTYKTFFEGFDKIADTMKANPQYFRSLIQPTVSLDASEYLRSVYLGNGIWQDSASAVANILTDDKLKR